MSFPNLSILILIVSFPNPLPPPLPPRAFIAELVPPPSPDVVRRDNLFHHKLTRAVAFVVGSRDKLRRPTSPPPIPTLVNMDDIRQAAEMQKNHARLNPLRFIEKYIPASI